MALVWFSSFRWEVDCAEGLAVFEGADVHKRCSLTKRGSLDRKILLLYLVCDADRSKINGVDMNLTTFH